MDPRILRELLDDVRQGKVSPDRAAEELRKLPYEDLGFAKVDHHRALRRGFPEAVFGEGKTPDQIAAIVDRIAARGQNVLVTRTTVEVHRRVLASQPTAGFHEGARCLTVEVGTVTSLPGRLAVVAAGTSDLGVAEEAAITASFYGATVDRIYDVGVAGLHRLLDRAETIRQARVVVVVAGMEGALPSVVAGLVAAPVIAVPTSVGYGASFHGLAALLAMLNSCASGVGVVNIDNGFGAGHLACQILKAASPSSADESDGDRRPFSRSSP
ncbi:MAG TPA: nickel pincer cofactor biosynthesis protein LarB [Vicinamibacteria bacterium]|nr:nickel pincer cofactor biosynthesis protein LarB [Vicinamibacteria bacterium]